MSPKEKTLRERLLEAEGASGGQTLRQRLQEVEKGPKKKEQTLRERLMQAETPLPQRQRTYDPGMGLAPGLSQATQFLQGQPEPGLEYKPKKKTSRQKQVDDKMYEKGGRYFDEKTQTAAIYLGEGKFERLKPKKHKDVGYQGAAGLIPETLNPLTMPSGVSKMASLLSRGPTEVERPSYVDEGETMLQYERDLIKGQKIKSKGKILENFVPTNKIDKATGAIDETWSHPAEAAVGAALFLGLGPAGAPVRRGIQAALGEFTVGTSDIAGAALKGLSKKVIKKAVGGQIAGLSEVSEQLIKKIPKKKIPKKKADVPLETQVPVKGKIDEGAKIGSEGKAGADFDDFAKKAGKKQKPGKGPIKEDPKYAGSVNLKRQRISEDAKQYEYELFDKKGKKTVLTHEELEKRAAKIVKDFSQNPAKLQKSIDDIKAGKTPTIDVELAHRQINANNMESLQKATQDLADGKITLDDFNAAKAKVDKFFLETTNPLASEAGRRLNMYNIEVGKHRALKAMNKLGKDLNPRQLEDLRNVDFNDPSSVKSFVDRLPDPKLQDYFWEYWYNSILSGVPTHVVNIASNSLWAAWQVPHRLVTAGFDKVFSKLKGREQRYFFSEILPMMAGMGKGFKRGFKEVFPGTAALPKAIKEEGFKAGVKKSWKMKKNTLEQSKFTEDIGASVRDAFDRNPWMIKVKGKELYPVRAIGKVITTPTRALRAMDVWANAISYDAQIAALARRSGLQNGLKGQALKDHVSKVLQAPPKEMMDEAAKHAKYTTFMDEPGKQIQKLIEFREASKGGWARLVMPFINTVNNLTKRGFEMTPGVGALMYKGRPAAEVWAKQLEGSVLAFTMYGMAAEGRLTGAAPQNEAEREAFYRQGKKPWAIKIGNEWYQYRRIEPFNTVIAAVTVGYDKVMNAPDDKNAAEQFMGVVQGLAENFIDSTYVSGLQEIMDRFGKFEQIAQRKAATLVPFSGFWRSLNRAYEAHMEGSSKLRETDDAIGAFAQVIPGLYKLKKPKLNVWGKEIELEGGFFRQWLPYKWSTETDDPVEDMLEMFKVYPAIPSKEVHILGEPTKLDDDLYDEYRIMFGHLAYTAMENIATPENPDYSIYSLSTKDGEDVLDYVINTMRQASIDVVKAKQLGRQGDKQSEQDQADLEEEAQRNLDRATSLAEDMGNDNKLKEMLQRAVREE